MASISCCGRTPCLPPPPGLPLRVSRTPLGALGVGVVHSPVDIAPGLGKEVEGRFQGLLE